LYITYLAVGADIDHDVDGCFSLGASRSRRVFRSQSSIRPRRAQALNFGCFLVFRCFLDYCLGGSCQYGSSNPLVFVTLLYYANQTPGKGIVREIL
jgi:hypothetical protein